ncbi:hypothetical protein [Comamonas thiooxydans]|uniref:hypothetical protein n=1 Tax=Comamonas thiooxydans TaxID=363952 RepID=UPI0020B67FEC|nr:hypothetical protein [Comamonas thiooxydans]
MAFGIWHLAFGIWHLAFGIWHLAFGIWHLAFGIWHPISEYPRRLKIQSKLREVCNQWLCEKIRKILFLPRPFRAPSCLTLARWRSI